jgi:hypothetical protein
VISAQIGEVLRSKALEHCVLVLTPLALESPVVRQEIRLARQEGKSVSVVRGRGLDFAIIEDVQRLADIAHD